MRARSEAENAAGDALLALTKPVTIDATSRFQLVQLIEAERSRSSDMTWGAKRQLDLIKLFAPRALGPEGKAIWYDYHGRDSTATWCRAHHLPLAPMPSV